MTEKIILHFADAVVAKAHTVVEDGLGDHDGRYAANLRFFSEEFARDCRFCGTPLTDLKLKGFVDVRECLNCGWWTQRYAVLDPGGIQDAVCSEGYIRNGIVRRYRTDDKKLPIDALLQEVAKRADVLHEVHPTKMEELVGHVFGQFYKTTATHCGRSHDGGVDLILVDGEEQVLVQVKRRQSPLHVEPVSTVREFLGAILLNRGNKGILVSTADHFSQVAAAAASDSIHLGLVTRFDLIDFKRFLAMTNVAASTPDKPWNKYLSRWYDADQ